MLLALNLVMKQRFVLKISNVKVYEISVKLYTLSPFSIILWSGPTMQYMTVAYRPELFYHAMLIAR